MSSIFRSFGFAAFRVGFAAFLVLTISPVRASDLFPPEAKRRLDASLAHVLAEHDLPSLAVLASVPGRGRYVYVGGVVNLVSRVSRREGQPFRIASLTKTFAATAVLLLVDRGQLKKTDPLARYFPDFPHADSITIDDLLRMRSGIASPSDEETVDAIYDDPTGPAQSLAERMAVSARMGDRFKPAGSDGVYSNLSYDILGGIVAKVTGVDISRFITTNVIDALDLRQTSYPTGNDLPGGLQGYGWNPKTHRFDDKTLFNPAIAGPAGAMISSLDDLDRFVRILCTGGLLAAETQRARLQGQHLGGGTTLYGEGVITGPGVCGHSGTIPGFSTDMYYFPKLDATMIISASRLDRDDKLQTAPAQKVVYDALVAAVGAN